jgi:hypothetical protein
MCFAVTCPLFIHFTHSFMRNTDGQNVKQAIVLLNISDDTRHVSEVESLLTLNHLVLLDSIRNHGKDALIKSLRSAHDSILYGSKVEITEIRDLLFDLKQLGDWLEEFSF